MCSQNNRKKFASLLFRSYLAVSFPCMIVLMILNSFFAQSTADDLLFETMLRIENKDIFVDLKKNRSGVYLKISERNGNARNTVLIPASGILRLRRVLDDVAAASVKTKSVR